MSDDVRLNSDRLREIKIYDMSLSYRTHKHRLALRDSTGLKVFRFRCVDCPKIVPANKEQVRRLVSEKGTVWPLI